MIRLIYIHPISADIKNELHKKMISSDNSRPCSAMIVFSTHTFQNSLFCVAGLLGEPLCVIRSLLIWQYLRSRVSACIYTRSRVEVLPTLDAEATIVLPLLPSAVFLPVFPLCCGVLLLEIDNGCHI